MARGGFERNGKKGGARFTFANDFKKDMLSARKKAGRRVGRQIVKDRIQALTEINKARIGGGVRTSFTSRGNGYRRGGGSGKLSPRRRKAIRHVVGRDGTLVLLDHAPMAVIQETGGIIKPKGNKLFIQDRRRRPQGPPNKTFATKKGLVFEVAPYKKREKLADGTFKKATKQPKPRLVGILVDEVVIRRLPDSAQFDKLSEKRLPMYRDLMEQYLTEGIR